MAKYHVHAINWNESRVLPVFFRHYASADRIFVHDNQSDKDVQSLIRKSGAELVEFSTGNTLNDSVNKAVKNHAWKVSRNSADYVIVQDLDEFVHFPWMPGDIPGALEIYKDIGVTFAKSKSYWPICSDSDWDSIISSSLEPWKLLNRGVRDYAGMGGNYDKVQVFNPSKIIESNFTEGAHDWDARGTLINSPGGLEPIMLHCKHIGKKYELGRRVLMGRRISEYNRLSGCGSQYQQKEAVIANNVECVYRDIQVQDMSAIIDDRKRKVFSNDWTQNLTQTLDKFFPEHEKRPVKILEIGCFEGRGTLLLLNKFCQHPGSVVHCVDPLEDRYVRDRREFKGLDPLFVGQRERFVFNTREWRKKIRVSTDVSDNVLPMLLDEYDLVYIDGDHHPEQVYKDGLMALRITKLGGFIVFDDYLWSHNGASVKQGVDRFVNEFSGCLSVINSGGQLIAQVKNEWSDGYLVRATQVIDVPCLMLETYGRSDAISAGLFNGHAWEPQVAHYIARFFEKYKNSAFVELGANIGLHTILAAKAGASHVFSFECHPICVKKLARNIDINRCSEVVTLIPLAASNSTGKSLTLRHVGGNVGASFIDSPENKFAAQSTGSYACSTVRLDDYMFPRKLESFDSVLVKIDVEGHELQALNGMRRVLSLPNIKHILLEVNPQTQFIKSVSRVLDLLASRKFHNYEVLLCIPPDGWHGPAFRVSDNRLYSRISRRQLEDLVANGAILELVISR